MSAPNIEPQNLARSCNEALILSCLESGAMHGYQIALEIQERGRGFFRFNYGTLDPILHKMKKNGLVSGTWTPREEDGSSPERRRKRKQYIMTEKGRKYAQQQRTSWRGFIDNFLHVLEVAES